MTAIFNLAGSMIASARTITIGLTPSVRWALISADLSASRS